MIIDKVAPFYTEQDRAKLAEYDRLLEAVIDNAGELTASIQAAQDAGDAERVKQLIDHSRAIWAEQYTTLEAEKNELLRTIEQRYIDSFHGDIAAILADVREIVNATDKEEYLARQRRRTEQLRPILEKKPGRNSSNAEKESYQAAKRLSVKGYVNCYYFILWRINAQLNALSYYRSEDGQAQAIAMVEARAGSYYAKPKGANMARRPIERELPIAAIKGADIRGDLLTLPASPALSLLYDVLGGVNLEQLQARKQGYNRNMQLLVVGQGDKRRISYAKDKTEVSIVIDDFRKIVNRNPQAKKILTRILLRANEQAIHNGELMRDKVSFPLRELVGEGQYKNIETARQGFYKVADTLTGLKISGKIEHGKKKTIQQGVHVVLFKAAKVNNATCEIYLNEMLNWGLITTYYTGLPDYYFELPDRAADLLEFIFYTARQNTKQIAEQGYFTISYRAIQYRLNLPNEIQNGKPINNPKRDIKDAIESAIEQIEEKHCKYAAPRPAGTEPDFQLLPLGNYDAPIKDYLDEGKLKVTLKGEYAKRFIEISQKTAARLEAAKRRQERIADQAKAIKLAKSMEADKEE